MAVNIIPNQVVKLFDTENFNQRNKRLTQDYRQYCQLVREEQTSMFQIQVTPETGDELLTNADFDSALTGWNYDYDIVNGFWQVSGTSQVQGKIGFAGFTDLLQNVTLTANKMYRLRADVLNVVSSTNLSIRMIAVAGESYDKTWYINDIGKQQNILTMYFFTNGYTDFDIKFVITGGLDNLVYLSAISLVELSEPVVTIEDCDGGVTQRTLTPFSRAEDRINYAIEWFGLTERCYRVCVTNVDDLDFNYLDRSLALSTEGGQPIELEQGGLLRWYG